MFKALWLLSVILTGITTGFYVSHSLILGRWYTWFTRKEGKLPLLYATYSEFRSKHSPIVYLIICYGQGLVILAFAVVATIIRKHAALSILSASFSMIAGILLLASGFAKLEASVLSGVDRSPGSIKKYSSLNIPMHIAFSILMLASFVGLLFVVLR